MQQKLFGKEITKQNIIYFWRVEIRTKKDNNKPIFLNF